MRASSDTPAPAHIGDALELADLLRPTWPEMQRELRESGVPLNDGEEEPEETGEEQPSSGDEHPQPGDQPDDGDEAFGSLDAYLPDELDDDAKPVFEAAYKRMQADYTKKRQSDTQVLREAQQAQQIVDGLADPQRAPAILQALGVGPELGDFEPEDDFGFDDPNDRIDALEAELRQRDQVQDAERRAQAENAFVTQQIEALEDELQAEFTDDEVGLLYMYADQYRDESGRPDVGAAHKVLDAIASTAQQRLITSKRRAPRRMGKGAPADRQVDLTDPEARRKSMEAAAAAARASLE